MKFSGFFKPRDCDGGHDDTGLRGVRRSSARRFLKVLCRTVKISRFFHEQPLFPDGKCGSCHVVQTDRNALNVKSESVEGCGGWKIFEVSQNSINGQPSQQRVQMNCNTLKFAPSSLPDGVTRSKFWACCIPFLSGFLNLQSLYGMTVRSRKRNWKLCLINQGY